MTNTNTKLNLSARVATIITVDIKASKSSDSNLITVGQLSAPLSELPPAISAAIRRDVRDPDGECVGYSTTIAIDCECTPWDGEGPGTTVVYPRLPARTPRANALTIESVEGEGEATKIHVEGGRVCYAEDGARKLFVVGDPIK